MQKYVFYNNVSGDIYYVRNITEAKATRLCNANTGMNMSYILESEITGSVYNAKHVELDLTTTPFSTRPVPPVYDDNLANKIKSQRNNMLTTCDWTQGADSPLSDAKKAEWQTYRQALRDFDYAGITEDINIPWPTRPE
jgi:hypothetical protein